MKRTIVTLLAGLAIGGTTLGPLAATAVENATLEERVEKLEYNFKKLCFGAQFKKPVWYKYLDNQGVC